MECTTLNSKDMNVILWILIGFAVYLVGVVICIALIAYINKKTKGDGRGDVSVKYAYLSFITIVSVLFVSLFFFATERIYDWFYNIIDD